jgi:single-strand DNA-binding protein
MAGSVNKVILVGNVGKDPEIRATNDGAKIASFSLATSEGWKDKTTGEYKDKTEWHRVVVFNENISNIVEKYIKKGNKVYVEGALQSRKYTGSDGVEKNITEIVITRFKGEISILDNKNQNMGSSSFDSDNDDFEIKKSSKKKSKDFEDTSLGDDLDDEIPF